METQAGFEWDERYLLGHGALDATHQEFVALVHALLTVADDGLGAALDAFTVHAEAHFEQENGWMRDGEFPARACHIDEHDKVLASVYAVREHLSGGDTAMVRELALALQDWFPGHADYMDSALAAWVTSKAHGGKPVIVRRHAAAGGA